jgi:hypothetical protein
MEINCLLEEADMTTILLQQMSFNDMWAAGRFIPMHYSNKNPAEFLHLIIPHKMFLKNSTKINVFNVDPEVLNSLYTAITNIGKIKNAPFLDINNIPI